MTEDHEVEGNTIVKENMTTPTSASDKPPMGVALIGSGIFAREAHLPAILSHPTLSLKAVFSRTLKSCVEMTASLSQKVDFYTLETSAPTSSPLASRTKTGKGEAINRSYEDLLSNPNIKAVIIALPITSQAPYIRQALEAGKHVLSEKPICADSAEARGLIEWYNGLRHKELHHPAGDNERGKLCSWSIAENWRFLNSHVYAAEEVKKLGKVLGFRARFCSMVKEGGKYFETPWRKNPSHAGGFLLDAAVHYIAALRLILGPSQEFSRISAFTSQLQPHLPPVDTVNATVLTKSGISGTFAVSFGTTFKGGGMSVACEEGTVTILKGRVVVESNGVEDAKDFGDEGSGVKQEVEEWVRDIELGVMDPRFLPEEGLKDLYILEAMLHSGAANGVPIDLPS